MITLQQRSHLPQDIGKLTGHKVKTSSQVNLRTLFCVLHLDDGAFPFEDCLQIELGLSLIHNHFVKFGLEMHIGRGSKASKTEWIFLPPPGFFNHKKIVSCEINGENTLSIRRSKQVKGESHEKKCKREESLYIALTEKNIKVWRTETSPFVPTSSTWAPGYPSHYGKITRWISVLPLRIPLWEKWRLFWMTTMSMCTTSTSYFEQFLATFLYGAVRVGPSDRHFWMLLKYSYTKV